MFPAGPLKIDACGHARRMRLGPHKAQHEESGSPSPMLGLFFFCNGLIARVRLRAGEKSQECLPVNKGSQTAIFWLNQIKNKEIEPRSLKPRQRALCVRHLVNSYDYTHEQMGAIMGLERSAITKMIHRILTQDSWVLDEMDARKMATDMMQAAGVCFGRLMKKGRERDAWNIKKELIETLQSLGYIHREALKVEGEMTLLEIFKLGQITEQSPRPVPPKIYSVGNGNGHGVQEIH